jgi:hypothetical protein
LVKSENLISFRKVEPFGFGKHLFKKKEDNMSKKLPGDFG